MILIHPFYLFDLLSPLMGGADIDEEVDLYSGVDSDNENEMRDIIRGRIKPYFDSYDKKTKRTCVNTLQYYLSETRYDYRHLFESMMIAFDPPRDTRLFFVWIWEELLGKKFTPANLDDYQVMKDLPYPRTRHAYPPPDFLAGLKPDKE